MSNIIDDSRNYEIVDIAEWFHKLSHLGFDLKPIKNSTFDPLNTEYVNSLGVFAAIPVVVLIIVLILYLFISICLCVCCTDGKKRKNIRIECKVLIVLFGLVCGLSFIAGLYGDYKIYESIKTVHNSSEDAVDWFNGIKKEASNVTGILDVAPMINELKKNLQVIGGLPLAPDVGQYVTDSDNILDYLRKTNASVINANNTVNKIDVDFVPNQIQNYGNLFCIVVLCVLLVLSIVGLVFTFSVCSRCLLGCLTVFAVLSLIISSLLVAITLAASVGVSDFCYDAKPWIKSQINNEVANNYLIDCNTNNQISAYLSDAQTFLNQAIDKNKNLENLDNNLNDYCEKYSNIPEVKEKCPPLQQNVGTSLTDLSSRLAQLRNLVIELKVTANCNRINTDLNDSLNSICTNVVKGVSMIFFNTIAASFCFAILVFGATFALR